MPDAAYDVQGEQRVFAAEMQAATHFGKRTICNAWVDG